jgi:hypothetical protein
MAKRTEIPNKPGSPEIIPSVPVIPKPPTKPEIIPKTDPKPKESPAEVPQRKGDGLRNLS